jgi:hypothetical protein
MGGQRSTYLKIRLTKEQRPTGVSRQTKLPRITKSGPAIGQKGSKEKTACSCPGSDRFLGPRFRAARKTCTTTILAVLQQALYFSLHEAKVRLTLMFITDASLSVDQKGDWKPKDTSI